jgi:hypothetical protein
MNASSGPITVAGKKDCNEEGKYSLIVPSSISSASLSLSRFLVSEMRTMANALDSVIDKGSSFLVVAKEAAGQMICWKCLLLQLGRLICGMLELFEGRCVEVDTCLLNCLCVLSWERFCRPNLELQSLLGLGDLHPSLILAMGLYLENGLGDGLCPVWLPLARIWGSRAVPCRIFARVCFSGVF